VLTDCCCAQRNILRDFETLDTTIGGGGKQGPAMSDRDRSCYWNRNFFLEGGEECRAKPGTVAATGICMRSG
jgi:hypothetical protein